MNNIEIPDEYRLILLTTRLDINASIQQKIRELLSSSVNWNETIRISNRQEILPFLYYNLNNLNVQNTIPQDIFAAMKNCYYANLHRNLMFEREISLLAELTNHQDININIILLKGLSLIQTLYHNPGLRIMADVDILIKNNDFQKVNTILTQLGYKESQKNIKDTFEKEILFSKRLSSNQSLFIEIHRVLVPSRPHRINLPYLWERIQEKTINNQKLFFLSQEDTFLSLALHLRRHIRRLTLKFIVDIAELLNINGGGLDWVYVKESGRNNHIMISIYLSLYLAKELLEANVSAEILHEFRPNIIKSALIHLTINKYNFFTLKKWQGIFLRLMLFNTPIDFFLYLWRVSFLERFLAKQHFRYIKNSITKRMPIDDSEKIKK